MYLTAAARRWTFVPGHTGEMGVGELELLLEAIAAVNAAGLKAELWPTALAKGTALSGGVAATLEVTARRSSATIQFHSHGVPTLDELAYVAHLARENPRVHA